MVAEIWIVNWIFVKFDTRKFPESLNSNSISELINLIVCEIYTTAFSEEELLEVVKLYSLENSVERVENIFLRYEIRTIEKSVKSSIKVRHKFETATHKIWFSLPPFPWSVNFTIEKKIEFSIRFCQNLKTGR